ncbi:MAG: universal stress protein [Deltaproteobacteria bacterium]
MIKKILVPYDNSRPAEYALNYAIDLVKNMKEQQQEIILLHVIKSYDDSMKSFLSRRIRSPKTGDTITLEQYLKDIAIEIKIDTKNMLEDKIRRIESNGFTLKSMVLYGNPAEEILKFSQLEKIDLIVMGNIGLKGISKIKTLGSVSRNVLENSECPVLIVHQ